MARFAAALLLVFGIASGFTLEQPEELVPRVDYDLGLVFLELWRGDYFIGIAEVIPLDDFLDYQLTESIVENWREQNKRERQAQDLAFDAKGLIPDIELPRLPVFGEGSRIDISGQDRITFGGRSTTLEGVTRTNTRSRLLPELKMEQQLSVRLNGQIGDRTKVNIDHDSERQEAKNKIRLGYEGTEDEIVQSVEIGDTRLSIPSTSYTGDLPAHKGLFGVSAQGKVADVDVYAIASREESQGQTQTFSGQRRVSYDSLPGRAYVRRRFYFIDAPDRIDNLRVYVDDKSPGNNEASVKAIATVFTDHPDSVRAEWPQDRAGGDFDLMYMGTDYILHPGNIIEFSSTLGQIEVVGLVIFTASDTVGGQYHNGDSLVLKLLKPEIASPLSLTWGYELKNVYALEPEIQIHSVRIFRDDPEEEGEDDEYETDGDNKGLKFVEILGLDPNGDGQVEYPQFDANTGFIRFPDLEPFASTELSVRDSVIYQTEQLDPGEGQRYYLVAEYSKATESYYLGQLDIEEGSEKVFVDGKQWMKGTDYDINYVTGMLSFRRALPPDADIRVTYEYRPWFSLSQKALLGTRAEWRFTDNGKVGTSVFYRSEGTPEDKPVLGSEPFQRMIAEADASYNVSSNEVSAFLDRLPLLRAQAPTTFSASAEGAVSLPDPNTRGVAYLDDFEGTTITRDMSMQALTWSHSSVPVGKDSAKFATERLVWLTPSSRIRKDSVFGPSIGEEGKETQDYMRVMFTPDPNDDESWAGIMTSPSQLGMNLKDIENLEMILKSRRGKGRIHVSVGMNIDEDAPRRNRAGEIVGLNGIWDTEDQNANGILDEAFEDTGLDGVYGADSAWVPDSSDDGNDDYDPDDNATGTEGNRRLDSEDLDRTTFSRYNDYFECEVVLGDPDYLASSLHNGWSLYRVSLHDSAFFERVGNPQWENIRTVRLWFDGFEGTDTIDVYSLAFVGSKWRSPRVSGLEPSVPPTHDTIETRRPGWGPAPPDTSEQVWVVQISKKSDTSYVPPFEPRRDVEGEIEQEAALLFGYQNLRARRQAVVSKVTSERDDYRDYRQMLLYVHDDGNDLAFALRLGSDSLNYYEYTANVTDGDLVPGRDGLWYEFRMDLDSFPELKVQRGDTGRVDSIWQQGSYRLRGSPSLAEISYTALGIVNPTERAVSGGLWFNDLRLTSVRKEPGVGFRANATLNLADFVQAGVSFGYEDPNFRRFSEGRGVKTGGFNTNLVYNVNSRLDRLLPHGWGLNLPIGYQASQLREQPKFDPRYADLRAIEDSTESYFTYGHSENISMDGIRKERTDNKLMNYTVEAMALGYRLNRGGRSGPLGQDSGWSSSTRWTYDVSPEVRVRLNEDEDLYLLPQGVRFGVDHGRRHNDRLTRTVEGAEIPDSDSSASLATDLGIDYSPIDDLSFDYGVSSDRDVFVPDSLWFLNIGTEEIHEENFSAGYSMDIGDVLSPSVDFDADYSHERTKLDTTYSDYTNMDNTGELDFGLTVDLPEFLGGIEERAKDRLPKPVPEPEPPKVPKDEEERGVGDGEIEPDSEAAESEMPEPKPPPGPGAVPRLVGVLSRAIDPIDLSYGISRSSDMIRVFDDAPWHYRFGFSDSFPFASTNEDSLPTSITRELRNSFRASSGARIKGVSARMSYDWSEDRSRHYLTTTLDRSITWPDMDFSINRVQTAFENLAKDSKITGRYRQRRDLGGQLMRDTVSGRDTLAMYGRTQTVSHEFSPLVSWQTTWKKRVSTTVSGNYSVSTQTSFRESPGERNETNLNSRGADISASYSFSAPSGLKIPGLRRIRFSSDLRLTGSFGYSQSLRRVDVYAGDTLRDTIPQQRDRSWNSKLAASYSFSRSVEAGLNFGLSSSKSEITRIETRTTDLDIWVLFRF